MLKAYMVNVETYETGEQTGKWIELPISKQKFNEELKEVNIDNKRYFEYAFYDYECNVPNLLNSIYSTEGLENASIEELNLLAYQINKLNIHDTNKLSAILEFKSCENFIDVLNYVKKIDSYYLNEKITDSIEVGKFYIKEILTLPKDILLYLNYSKLGEYYLEKEKGKLSQYGLLEMLYNRANYYNNIEDVKKEYSKIENEIEIEDLEIEVLIL